MQVSNRVGFFIALVVKLFRTYVGIALNLEDNDGVDLVWGRLRDRNLKIWSLTRKGQFFASGEQVSGKGRVVQLGNDQFPVFRPGEDMQVENGFVTGSLRRAASPGD